MKTQQSNAFSYRSCLSTTKQPKQQQTNLASKPVGSTNPKLTSKPLGQSKPKLTSKPLGPTTILSTPIKNITKTIAPPAMVQLHTPQNKSLLPIKKVSKQSKTKPGTTLKPNRKEPGIQQQQKTRSPDPT